MKAINIEKFICSMLQYAEDNCEETMLDYLHSALQDQGLEYKDREIVSIEPDFTTITIPKDLKGTDTDGGVVGEKGEQGEQPTEEEMVGMGELGKVWSEQAIISKLDKIIELLQSTILPISKSPYVPPTIYKNPLDLDPTALGGWGTNALLYGADYDIDTDKIKQNETNKPES